MPESISFSLFKILIKICLYSHFRDLNCCAVRANWQRYRDLIKISLRGAALWSILFETGVTVDRDPGDHLK